MKYQVMLEAPVTVVSHVFDKVLNELFVHGSLSEDCPAMMKILNPQNQCIGQLHFQYSNYMKMCHITGEKATMNGMMHRLMAGTYQVEIYRLSGTKPIQAEIVISEVASEHISDREYQEVTWFDQHGSLWESQRVYSEEKRYFKGDFHSHTLLSDGKVHPDQVEEYLGYEGLDFTAMTEHNLLPFGFSHVNRPMIPSFELTLNEGHMNIHGIKNSDVLTPDRLQAVEEKDINRLIKSFSDKGMNFSLNHMFMNPWHWRLMDLDIRLINTIEVICDPTYPTAPEANDRAIEFLDFLWQEGIKIYGIGGSDSHELIGDLYKGSDLPSVYGDPGTYVYCEGLSADNVIKGVQNGHSYVSRFFSMDIGISNGKLLPGDQIGEDIGGDYRVTLKDATAYAEGRTYIGRYIVNGVTVHEKKMGRDKPEACLRNFRSYLPEESWGYIRFGLYDTMGHAIAFVNPVYIGQKEPKSYLLGELLEVFDSHD